MAPLPVTSDRNPQCASSASPVRSVNPFPELHRLELYLKAVLTDLDRIHTTGHGHLPSVSAQLALSNRVKKSIRKPLTQSAADRAQHDRTCLWMFSCRYGASPHFRDECDAKPRLLVLVVLRRVIEFALGQLVERDAHSLDPGPCLAKHLVCRAA